MSGHGATIEQRTGRGNGGAPRLGPVSTRAQGLPVALVCGLLAVCARLPFLGAPLKSDEGGLLLVASQWRPGGTSLYGNYWVDRPPLLIDFFALADDLGGAVGLRLLGCVLAVSVVALAHLSGHALTAPGTSCWPVIGATAFVCLPIMGSQEVNGELIAAPLVLLGVLVAIRATTQDRSRLAQLLLWATAGALGAAAAMVKQNFLDVFVFGSVLLIAQAATRCMRAHDTLSASFAFLSGAAVSAGMILGPAARRGTFPRGLWDALVVFRFEAATVIGRSAGAATHERFLRLVLVMWVSGSLALIGCLAAHAVRRRRSPIVVAAAGLLGWELFAVLAGGSYWLHYLIGLVPGLVLAVALLTEAGGRMAAVARATTAYAAVIALATTAAVLVTGLPTSTADRVGLWLQAHARRSDSAVVLYGQPSILETAGVASPYPELWSLPVRVRDPNLDQLIAVLRSDRAPTWVLAWHDMSSWGISSQRAHRVVTRRYQLVGHVCGVAVYVLDGHRTSPIPPADRCKRS